MFKKRKNKIKLSKQKLALIIISPLAILAIILVVIDIYNRQKDEDIKKPGEIVSEEGIDREEIEIVIPDPDTELTEEQRQVIAVPEKAVSINPDSGTTSQHRNFNFNLENDSLINVGGSGREINVYQYDDLSISFTAIDKDYDINIPDFFGRSFDIKAGETIRRSFQVTNPGSFPYYCQICGGVNSQASGLINVIERD